MCYDARASPLAAIASEVAGVVKASRSGAMGVEGVVDSLPPLPASSHLGPVAAKFLEEKNIDFICANRLKRAASKGPRGSRRSPP